MKAAFLGTSALSDAFSIAFLIPNLMRRLFAEGSVTVAFIPTFKTFLIKNDRDKIKEFFSSVFTLLSFTVSLVVIFGIAAAPLIVSFFKTDKTETVFLTRIMFPYLGFISIAAFFQGILNGKNRFGPSGFVPILFNLSVIGCTMFLSQFTMNPARAMAAGVLLGGVIQAVFQLPFVIKTGYNFCFISLKKALKNPGARNVGRLIAPTIIGMAAYQLNNLIASVIASNSGEGIVSSLQFSLRLQELILGIFAVSFGTVMITELSGNAKKRQWKLFNTNLLFCIRAIALITIPVMFFCLLTGRNIIELLFKIRNFTDKSVDLTLSAFTFHIAGLFFIALSRIIAPAFYAQEDAKTPTFAGIVSVLVSISLAIILADSMKGGGIALATSIAALFNSTILLVALSKKKKKLFLKTILSSAGYSLKILILSFVASIPVFFVRVKLFGVFMGFDNKLFSTGLPLLLLFLLFSVIMVFLLAVIRDEQFLYLTKKKTFHVQEEPDE